MPGSKKKQQIIRQKITKELLNKLKTMWDVQQLLKRYGIFVYVGDRLADLELMEAELKDLYDSKLLDIKDFQQALLIVRQEHRLEREKRGC